MRIPFALPVAMTGLLVLGLAAAHADVPNWCKTLGGEAVANSPSCQEPIGPCHDMDVESRQLRSDWHVGHDYLSRQRYNRSITVRDSDALRAVSSSAQARSMVSRAESRFPQLIDAMVAHDCELPIGVDESYTHPVLRAMADRGDLSWDRWTQWIAPERTQ